MEAGSIEKQFSTSSSGGANQRVTLTDLSALQLLLGNVLKALTTLSEDVKVLRGDVDSITNATAKVSLECVQVKRSVAESYPTRQEMTSAVDILQQQHEALSLRVAEHQATNSRDREIVVQRISAIEVQRTVERKQHAMTEERLDKVEQFTAGDGGKLVDRVDAVAAQQAQDQASLVARVAAAETTVASLEEALRRNASETSGISAMLLTRVDQSDAMIQNLEAVVDHNRTTTSGHIQRVAAELARNEGIQAHVTTSLTKLVDGAMEQRVGELHVALERLETSQSKKMQHATAMLDVRMEGIKEHVHAMSNELSDVKSEVSVFNNAIGAQQGRLDDVVATLQEKVDAYQRGLDERLQRSRAAQSENAKLLDAQVVAISEELSKTVELGQHETERKVKQMLHTAFERHDHVLLDQLVAQQKEQAERVHSEVDTIRQHVEDNAAFWRLRLGEQAANLKSLFHVLFMDPDKLPTEAQDRLRYLRSLPWCSVGSQAAGHTPVIVGPQSMSSASGGSNLSMISPTLGVEVRNVPPNTNRPSGIEVVNVVVDGAAYLSGVRVGDVIVAVGENVVADVNQFAEALRLESSLGHETPRLWLRREGTSSPERRFFA